MVHNYFGISYNKTACFKERCAANLVNGLSYAYVPLFISLFERSGLVTWRFLGNVPSRIVYYLMNINAAKRTIYLVRVDVRLFLINFLL